MKNSILKSSLVIIFALIATLAFSQKKETRDVGDFNSIGMGIHAELYFSQGSPRKVIIEASEDQLEQIETVVKNGHLRIKTDSWRTRFRDVKIWITAPDINGFTLSGSGKMIAETPVSSDELDIGVSGSGKITIDELKGKELAVAISGSGDVYLGGTAEELDLGISGSGSMYAKDLQVTECDASISGSGSCEIDATGELNASISGSGRITYFSNPQVDVRVSGSGKVRKGEK